MSDSNTITQSSTAPIPEPSPKQSTETVSAQQAGTSAQASAPAQAASRPQSQEAPTQPTRVQPEEPIPTEDVQDVQPDEIPDGGPEEPIPSFQAKSNGSGAKPQTAQPVQPPPYRLTSSPGYFQPNGFDSDIAVYRAYANNKTGYANLDACQHFLPGLYGLGAISSLGKTTCAYQMADQIATLGKYVLFFSLEQTRFELYSKSIARYFFQTQQETDCHYPTPSSVEIRSGVASDKHPKELAEQVERYVKAVGNRMIIVDGMFSMTVEDIEAVVERYVAFKPVVIVDYLQIVAPSMSMDGRRRMDAREAIDHIVHRLKAFQSKYDLTVIVISSLNRQNYLVPIDFESFKESGGIEYTADVMWGLQLAVMSDPVFGKEGNIKEKRDKVRIAKAANPRSIDLVCLKNRFGQTGYTAQFNYFPASDAFQPVCSPPIAKQGKVKQY